MKIDQAGVVDIDANVTAYADLVIALQETIRPVFTWNDYEAMQLGQPQLWRDVGHPRGAYPHRPSGGVHPNGYLGPFSEATGPSLYLHLR